MTIHVEWLRSLLIPARASVARFTGLFWFAMAGVAWAQAGTLAEHSSAETVQAVRLIDDPQSGSRWLLIQDRQHPTGPGRLVRVAGTSNRDEALIPDQDAGAKTRHIRPPLSVVIRGGDPLIVEDDNGNAKARLEAVALGPAVAGSEFQARLKIGGSPIKVVALAPGHAKIATRIEVRQ